MIDLLCAFRSPSHPIRLNCEFCRDLAWWLEFLQFLEWSQFLPHAVDLFLSQSICHLGFLGFGAIWRNAWLAGSWPVSVLAANITALELFPIVVVAHVWGCQWARLQVEFLCDNHAVVAIINSGSSRDPLSMHLMRRLVLVACQFHFLISTRHVRGCHNAAADSLSFLLSGIPQASSHRRPEPHPRPSSSRVGVAHCELELQCLAFLCQGLVTSSRRTYAFGMKKFWSFCALFPDLFPSSPVPMFEFQLMMFVSWLAQSLPPASVDVYLAAVHSYHIDWSYSDPTQNKPRLRRVLQGIHRSHGAARPPRRPITRDILCPIHRILSLPNSGFDSLMFWSACSLVFFGFLRMSEFTSSSPFDPAHHLAPTDIEFLPGEPSPGLRLHIKFSKTDPFALVTFSTSVLLVLIYAQSGLFAPTLPIMLLSPALYSFGQTVVRLPPIRSTIISTSFSHELMSWVRFHPTAFVSARRRRQLPLVSLIILFKLWVVGRVRRIIVIFVLPRTRF